MDVSMTACFYCGESTGIAIGKKFISCKNKWDTKYIFGGYEPCDVCKEKFSKGFLILECQDTPIGKGQPAINGKDAFPTGSYWLMKNDAALRIFTEEILENEMVYVDKETAEKLGLYQNKEETNEKDSD